MHFAPTTESDRTYIARLNFLTDVFGDEHAAISEEFDRDFDYYVRDWQPEGGGFIAWDGGIPAGGVWLVYGTEERHGYGHYREGVPELAIAVEPRYRGKGVAAQLLDIVEGPVSLSVHPDNKRAYQRYLKSGFQPTGLEREGHVVLMRNSAP